MVNKAYPDTSKMVFVFGSNESGFHGGGAAAYAYKHKGARWGFSYGHMGQSFAIPTKSQHIAGTLPLRLIKKYVDGFLAYAAGHPEIQFQVTCIGCGLAGLQHEDVAPMFDGAPDNCWFDGKWALHTGIREDRIWGAG
ncbi:hypothetical protein [Aquabacterium sp.]|uniref:A1S_2505 family phage non-structural protein n=1 Tax=Aquabacterium sp. TaxID=1872578 RepID=UPI0025C4625D|nr:hypothetical protein [Aquabacterium sp.]